MSDSEAHKKEAQKLANAFERETSELYEYFKVNPETGLTSEQVKEHRKRFGENALPPEEGTPLWVMVLRQFEDTLVIILICAALVSFFLAFFEEGEEATTAFVEPLVIVLILVANATVGVLQESGAESAVEALKAYDSADAAVIRDGKIQKVPADELVCGDIVEIEVGDLVPADIRLTHKLSSSVDVAQAMLTGESYNVAKEVEPIIGSDGLLQDKKNILFSVRGTNLARGKGRGIVVATGINTEKGKIAHELSKEDSVETPLKKKLDAFGTTLSKAIGVICVVVWLINIGHFGDEAFGGVYRGAIYYFKIAVSLAVAAIPEGLPAVVTTCLALGTQRMAKKNAIVRVLPAVETLGCTSVICSDKTGTLTTNQMSVQKFFIIGADKNILDIDVEGDSYAPVNPEGKMFKVSKSASNELLAWPANEPAIAKLAAASALCNDSSITISKDGKYEKIGQSTEAAIKVLVEKLGIPDKSKHDGLASLDKQGRLMACSQYWEEQAFQKEFTCEFNRARKSMSVLVTNNQDKTKSMLVKGAWDNLLERCTDVYLNDGTKANLSDSLAGKIKEAVTGYCTGNNHFRCLAIAIKEDVDTTREQLQEMDALDFINVEQNLTFIGVVGILDPPRAEVLPAIAKCKTAGIRVIVITGDNISTAKAICRKIGVFEPNEDADSKSFTGAQFKKMTKEQKLKAAASAKLFARVEPVDKKELVDLLHQLNQVVAMTGDGVNDAPALQAADIGLAMGSGTSVAKQASAMILADDNFTTIVAAVEEGRNIYNNTKQFIRYLITSNIGEVVAIFITAVFGLPEVLLPVQLLWVNLVTDGLPAVALGFNAGEEGIMEKPPRPHDEAIVSGFTFVRYMVTGIYIGIATVAGMIWWFTMYHQGPQLEYSQLFVWAKCNESYGIDCSVFHDNSPGTISLSILVTIEMFCALNSLSEKHSLISASGNPATNFYLLGAMSVSFGLHFVILYVPFLARIFSVTPIQYDEWVAVVVLALPSIFIDEVMKAIVRYRDDVELKTRLAKTN